MISRSDLSWTQFLQCCTGDPRLQFEEMTRRLFVAEFLNGEALTLAESSHPGIEVNPILEPNHKVRTLRKRISFQSKFFDSNVSYGQIKESAEEAAKRYRGQLDRIYLFCNLTINPSRSSIYKSTVKLLQDAGIELIPISNTAILDLLFKYDDIASYYFLPRTRTFSREGEIYMTGASERSSLKGKSIYSRLMKRFLNQYNEHPSIKMMTPDPGLFPKGLPAITNTERKAKEGDSEPLIIKDMIIESWKKPERKHILFVGEGGIGKTVAMLTLPKENWFRRYKIPVIYVPLQSLDVYEGKLNDYINDKYRNELNSIYDLAASPWKSHPNLIMLLDGFNEIPMDYKKTADGHLREWMKNPGVQIITTSRLSFFLDNSFLEYTLQPLSYETISDYLITAGISRSDIPLKNNNIYKVINVPLMLMMFTQIDKVKERTKDSKLSEYLIWKDSDNATHIIWNYLQVELYRLINSDESNSVLLSTAILAVAPYVSYELAKNGQFYVEQEKYQEMLRRAVAFFSNNQTILPSQIENIRYRFDKLKNEKPFEEDKWKNYFVILTEQSVLFQEKLNTDGNGNQDIVYVPAHQNFRDALAAIFISECMISIANNWDKQSFFEEILITADYYEKAYISEFLSDRELLRIWDFHRVKAPDNGRVTWILMDIIGRKRNYDLRKLDFSNLNLSEINLFQIFSRRVDICPLPVKMEMFNKTIVSMKNFIQEGHSCSVYSLAFSLDGRQLASGSGLGECEVRIWNLESGTCQVLKGHTSSVRCITFSQDGSLLASGSSDNTVRIWNLEKGTCKVFTGHKDEVNSVEFICGSKYLISCSCDSIIRIWNLESDMGWVLDDNTNMKANKIFCFNGKYFAREILNSIQICDFEHKTSRFFKGHTGLIRCIKFSPDGTQLASGSTDKTVRIWNLENETSKVLRGHTRWINDVVFSPDGRFVASGSIDKTVMVWDLESSNSPKLLSHASLVNRVMFSADGRQLACGLDDGSIFVWDLESGTHRVMERNSCRINSLAISPDGKIIAAGLNDKTVRVWNLEDDSCRVIESISGRVNSVAFSPNGRLLAVGSSGPIIQVWNLESDSYNNLEGHFDSVNSVTFSTNGREIVSGSNDKTVRIWDLKKGGCKVLKSHSLPIISVACSPDGKQIASCSRDRTVRVWDLKCGISRVLNDYMRKMIASIVYSPDGRQLAGSDLFSSLLIWNIENDFYQWPKYFSHWVYCLAYSPDGKELASGGDKTIRIWDTMDGKSKELKGYTNQITAVAYSPDGKYLVSGSDEGTVLVREISTGKFIKRFRAISNINFNGANFLKAKIPDEEKIIFREAGAKA